MKGGLVRCDTVRGKHQEPMCYCKWITASKHVPCPSGKTLAVCLDKIKPHHWLFTQSHGPCKEKRRYHFLCCSTLKNFWCLVLRGSLLFIDILSINHFSLHFFVWNLISVSWRRRSVFARARDFHPDRMWMGRIYQGRQLLLARRVQSLADNAMTTKSCSVNNKRCVIGGSSVRGVK